MADRMASGVGIGFGGGLVGLALGLAIGAWSAGGSRPGRPHGGPAKRGGPPPARVRLGEARAEVLRNRFEAIGRLEAVRRSTLTAEVAGALVALPVEPGDRLAADETAVARVDDVWARLELAAAKAEVRSVEAKLDQARRDLASLEQLLAAESAKPKEVEDARARVKSLEAELAAAQARRRRAATRLERTTITAPFDARVTRKRAEVGQWVSPGTPVAEVVSRGKVDARLYVPEHRVNAVERGDKAEVLVEPIGKRVRGPVVAIAPSGQNPARSFVVEVRLDGRGGALKPGMSVVGHLPAGPERERLTVPRRAVSFSAHGAVVWIAAAPGEGGGKGRKRVARPVPVSVLFGAGERFAVTPRADGATALRPGAAVVIEGWERLAPGRPLVAVDGANARRAREKKERAGKTR